MRKVQGNRDQMKGMLVVVSAQSKKLCHHGKCSSQVDGLTVGEIQRVVESQRLVFYGSRATGSLWLFSPANRKMTSPCAPSTAPELVVVDCVSALTDEFPSGIGLWDTI